MEATEHIGEVIEFDGYSVSQSEVRSFIDATGSQYIKGIPPTLGTVFRKTEYDWLDRLEVDLKMLLHGDQEYEYVRPLKVGCKLSVRTKLDDVKERNTKLGKMQFVRVVTELLSDGEVAVIGKTTFVVRHPAKEAK